MTRIAPGHLLLLLGITLIWGLNLVASKYGVEHIPPILFTTLRFLVVAGFFSGTRCLAMMFAGLALAGNVSSVAIASQLGVPFTTLLSVAALAMQGWFAWISLPILVPLTLALERPEAAVLAGIPGAAWGALASSALGASVIAHTGFYQRVQR
jgi:hypothetical protein